MHCDTSLPDPKSKQYFFQNIVYMEITWLYVIICDSASGSLIMCFPICFSFFPIHCCFYFFIPCLPSLTNRHLYSLASATELPRAFLYKCFHWHEPSFCLGTLYKYSCMQVQTWRWEIVYIPIINPWSFYLSTSSVALGSVNLFSS